MIGYSLYLFQQGEPSLHKDKPAYQKTRAEESSRGFVISGEREELLVDLAPFINICVQVNFRRLYGGVA